MQPGDEPSGDHATGVGAAETTTGACLGSETMLAWLDRRADSGVRARIEEHASRCASCRIALSSLARGQSPEVGGPASPPAADPAPASGTRFGRYVLIREIGIGGMGVVHVAHDPELHRMVAVKVLRGDRDRSLQERLRREAQAMAQLAHPNVVTVHDVGVFDDRLFITMEYVAGETLAQWAARPHSLREILDAYCAAGRGLAAAHAAGIVHRDFKPANVLVGADGRVLVGDFGLARPVAAHAHGDRELAGGSHVSPCGTAMVSTLTAPGTLLGTPYYMAPEVHAGAEADARSDQFSFCVALFAAIAGERPFAGDTLRALSATVRSGAMRRGGPRVPRRIRAALGRGLSVDPAARFSSVDELLGELQPSRRSTRRWALAATALAICSSIAWWRLAPPSAASPDQRCTGAASAFASAWNDERRAAITDAFRASRVVYARDALAQVLASLDRYAARWTQGHTDACRATRVLGEQTESMLALRMACLERRRQEAAALVSTLAASDDAAIARSAAAAGKLVDVAACADIVTLGQITAPPAAPGDRAKLAALAPRLAEARARYETGAFTAARDLARGIAAEAHLLGYRPIEAETAFLQGQIEYALGDMNQAEHMLDAAASAAEAGRHDDIAARAWVRLVSVVGYKKAEYARGLALATHARAAIERLGGNADIESGLERALGVIESGRSDLEAAIPHYERATALGERAFGPEDSSVAISLENLGIALLDQGHAPRAARLLERASAIQHRLLGPDHPQSAHALMNLANAHNDVVEPAVAEQELRRALAVYEVSLGPRHPDLAYGWIFLGAALDDQGKHDEAVAADRRGVAIGELAFGVEHPVFAAMLVDLGVHLGHAGHGREASDQIRRAEALLTRVHGPDHPQVMFALVARADLWLGQARWRAALELYERAIQGLERFHRIGKELTRAVVNREQALIALHQPERGLAALEHLVAGLDDARPDLRAIADFTLARALWLTGADRARARVHAASALTRLRRVPGATGRDVAQIERWLARHSI